MIQFCYLRLHLGTETVSCRLLQQRVARMVKPIGNVEPTFSISKAPCKQTQHCWPTTPNIVRCYMLRPFAHPVGSSDLQNNVYCMQPFRRKKGGFGGDLAIILLLP